MAIEPQQGHVSDCDVIRAEHRWRNNNCAVFCSIQGADPDHRISDVVFENLRIDGKLIGSAQEGRFEIDPATTREIRFTVTAGP